MFSVAPNILLAPNMTERRTQTQNTEHKHCSYPVFAKLRIVILQLCCRIKNCHTSGMMILDSLDKQKKYANQTETQTERIFSHQIFTLSKKILRY